MSGCYAYLTRKQQNPQEYSTAHICTDYHKVRIDSCSTLDQCSGESWSLVLCSALQGTPSAGHIPIQGAPQFALNIAPPRHYYHKDLKANKRRPFLSWAARHICIFEKGSPFGGFTPCNCQGRFLYFLRTMICYTMFDRAQIGTRSFSGKPVFSQGRPPFL